MFTIYTSPQGPEPLVPDVLIDFADGYGIPVANGGIGGPGSNLVQITSPQDGASGARLVRAPRYWDPQAEWRPGEPIFVPKQANRLVGWPGPRAGGYWTGPMPDLASTSETVAVYQPEPGRTVTEVAGGVVGPTAIRVDVEEGWYGGWWAASNPPVMTSGWGVGNYATIAYMHAVVELLGNINNHHFSCGLYDVGAGVTLDHLHQYYDAPDGTRSGKLYRGVGPHGGHLYEIWGFSQLTSAPVGPLVGNAYLLLGVSEPFPARTVIIHGLQRYFVPWWREYPLVGVPPFFSLARGSSVVWTAEELRVNNVTGAYTAAADAKTLAYSAGLSHLHARILARNGNLFEAWTQLQPSVWSCYAPGAAINGYTGKSVSRVEANYARAATVDGQAVHSMGSFDGSVANPSYLALGLGQGYWYGQMRRVLLWRRALTDTEMLKAWRAL